eukprot:CAMPEP_0194033272 /NCGR_PEP_ID=MMETSP0009_2-20130614/6027_1 /TAXON_ID=210454 /ORGANISM="Grammatophora oceanica, Strain CCMP 410" /LENGTH=75 /DNA_ID=CAMNT_0038673939 /DNA_START=1 /DNA_END=228 /DNA_ORIENTATION=-
MLDETLSDTCHGWGHPNDVIISSWFAKGLLMAHATVGKIGLLGLGLFNSTEIPVVPIPHRVNSYGRRVGDAESER